ncbi:hypothetical protein K490DRAFT_63454 [Saccharata proteae CBS 121410]|uniref:Uncharacterized protein n=1 Tax=Saccharata proteae CBS 121410 TaxID=1314787 RepID=A0A6A5YC86_9PEZI|nr:hypothetical protein K490DRAFT_63454 [Saccharata proteae CBS 121410]
MAFSKPVIASSATTTTTTNQPEAATPVVPAIEQEETKIKTEEDSEESIMDQETIVESIEVDQEAPPQRNIITIRYPHLYYFVPAKRLFEYIEGLHELQLSTLSSGLLDDEPDKRRQLRRIPKLGLAKTLVKTPVGKHYSCPMLPYARTKDFFRRLEHQYKNHVSIPSLLRTYMDYCRDRSRKAASKWEMAALLIGAEQLREHTQWVMYTEYDKKSTGALLLAHLKRRRNDSMLDAKTQIRKLLGIRQRVAELFAALLGRPRGHERNYAVFGR